MAWTTLVLLASAPFAVYYATEARMYALVILLTGCGFLALHRASRAPRPGNLIAVAVVAAALLYTQYWSLYLVGVVGLWLVASICADAPARPPRTAPWAPADRSAALVGGCVLFVPWLPTFIYQSPHTGTPWAAPPNFSAVINAVTGFTDNQGPPCRAATNQGRLLALIYFSMLALALFGDGPEPVASSSSTCAPGRAARGVAFVVVGTLFAAIAGGIITRSAFSLALRRRGLPAASCCWSRWARPRCSTRRSGRPWWPWRWSPASSRRAQNVHTQRTQAAPGGGGDQRAGQAGRHHRLLPRPARARPSTG